MLKTVMGIVGLLTGGGIGAFLCAGVLVATLGSGAGPLSSLGPSLIGGAFGAIVGAAAGRRLGFVCAEKLKDKVGEHEEPVAVLLALLFVLWLIGWWLTEPH